MFPPSDSINHQSLKLAEFVASLRSQNRLAYAPPPPYTISTVPTLTDDSLADIVDVDDEDEEETPSMAPIIIKIDTSIDIEGQGNTIVIPTSIGRSTAEEAPSIIFPSSSQTSEKCLLQQLQKQRQFKSAQLASTIISALKTSGVLDDRETGKQQPVEVNVSSGIRIRGDRNVVCAGVPKKEELTPAESEDSSSEKGPSSLSSEWGRKRRASSQPVDMPSAKRNLSFK
ncbi:hypothetical protein PAAG_07468 [Paracoccidioides lutzii Pb01]|uniref:Uncharacterized protein n=1 Tax=Paracoccidioides lutzii (strain ATCC MYA-826 / Pb01) TaxID=502779 RepID=C1H9M7_PARBA|nr:hypothetical protein PAAG_07468 [Paracoccidioides lutzii Pb01]EEH37050.1 hypothetical protein PAAG_07468 [Paracoccidioides lutzii Pb01]